MTPYEELIRCTEQLQEKASIGTVEEHDFEAVRRILDTNRAILDAASELLKQPMAVPFQLKAEFLDTMTDDICSLRELARFFRADAAYSAECGDYDRSIGVCLDLLKIAQVLRRGGLLIGALMGNNMIGMAVDCLRKLRKSLSIETALRLASSLAHWEVDLEDMDSIIALDGHWTSTVQLPETPIDPSAFILPEEECDLSEEEQRKLFDLVTEMGEAHEREDYRSYRDQEMIFRGLTRLLQIELLLAASFDLHDRLPMSLDELQRDHPAYTLPLDPFSEKPFSFRRFGHTGYWLYSVGPKRYDAGGRFGSLSRVSWGQADLCLDHFDFED